MDRSAKWKRHRSVIVLENLRIHTIPKVASSSIIDAAQTMQFAYPEEVGLQKRFMVVRHPLDRLVSTWAFFLKGSRPGGNELTHLGYEPDCSFDAFVDYCLDMHDANKHTRMQWLYKGPWLVKTVKFENLKPEWEALRERFPELTPLRARNPSTHDGWKRYYTPELRRIAEKHFAADMVLYHEAL